MSLISDDNMLLKLLFEPDGMKSPMLPDTAENKAFRDELPNRTNPNLLEQALREGVSCVLFYNIKKYGLTYILPQNDYRKLSSLYYTNMKRNLQVLGALRAVLEIFQEANIPCIILKGIALAEHVYPSIAMREMSDVDILVKKEDLFKSDECLFSLGYTSRDSTLEKALLNPVGYLASLEYRRNAPSLLNLHVHWHPVNTSVPAVMFAERIDTSRLWENAEKTIIADCQVLTLCPEHMIIYLCEHALRVGHSFDRLILVCDIFYAIKAFEHIIDWDFVTEESRRFNLSRFVYHGLSIVKRHTALDIPDMCIEKMRPPDTSLGERYFLKLQRNNRRIRGSSYFIYLAMNRGFFPKVEFIIRTFFPPRQILMQRQYLKGTEFSTSFYILRIGEIFSHIWESLAPGRTKKYEDS
jgi:hypothetical protein